MNYLSIDYGTKKMGLAVNIGSIAIPLKIIKSSDAISEIMKTIKERKINVLIIGIAHHINGEESSINHKVKSFVGELKGILPTNMKIFFQDESYTSFEAKSSLEESGIKSKDIKKIDDMAACLILQSYLDEGNV